MAQRSWRSTYDSLALSFAEMRVKVWDLSIDNVDKAFFEALLVVQGRLSAVRVAMRLDVTLLCHVGGNTSSATTDVCAGRGQGGRGNRGEEMEEGLVACPAGSVGPFVITLIALQTGTWTAIVGMQRGRGSVKWKHGDLPGKALAPAATAAHAQSPVSQAWAQSFAANGRPRMHPKPGSPLPAASQRPGILTAADGALHTP